MTPDLTEVLARLQRLEDVEIARNIHHAYAEALDDPVPEVVAGLFRSDGVLVTPIGSFEGHDAIVGFYEKAFAADPSVKRHFISGVKVVGVAGRVVRLQAYFHYYARGRRSALGWGTYDDEVDVSDGTPRLARKTIGMDMATTLERGWQKESDD